MPFISVDGGGSLIIEDVFSQKKVISDIGGCWDGVARVWRVVFTVYNLEYLLNNLKSVSVAENMEQMVIGQQKKEDYLGVLRDMSKQDVPVCLKIPGLKGSPYNYQRLGIMYSVANGSGVLVADEMGLGKTLQSIAAAVYLKSKGQVKSALCITPASLKFNWPLEIEKFTDEKYVVIDGDPEDRIAQWFRNDVFFYVVNYELIIEDLFGGKEIKLREKDNAETIARKKIMIEKAKRRARILEPIRRKMWDFVVVDECHSIKNSSSRRSQCVKELRARFRMALTGTPMDGRLEEMHSIMGFVAPGLLGSKTRFFQRHVETDFWGKITGYKRMGEVSDRIKPFFIRRLKKDVLKDLPDKIYQNRIITLSSDEREIYNALASRAHEMTEDSEAMVAIIRCKQFCNYPPMIDDSCSVTSKFDALRDILDEVVIMSGNRLLLFSQYKQMVDVLVRLLDDMGLKYLRIDGDTPTRDRADMQALFRDDKSIDIMVGTDAMSTGLNLQSASYVVNYDDRWSPSTMSQREDRAHRHGQKQVVTVINFICKDTIEHRIRQVIYDKNRVTAEVLGDNTDETILKRLGPKDMLKLL